MYTYVLNNILWILASFLFILLRYNIKNGNNYILFDLTFFPTSIITLLYISLAEFFGLYDLDLFFIFIYFLFYAVVFLSCFVNKSTYTLNLDLYTLNNFDSIIGLIFALLALYNQYIAVSTRGYFDLVYLNNEKLNTAGGIYIFFTIYYFILIFSKKTKNGIDYLCILICFFALFLTFVKGVFIIVIFASFLYKTIYNRQHYNLLKYVVIGLFGVLLFYLSYIVRVYSLGIEMASAIKIYNEAFISYFFSGIGGFNANLIKENVTDLKYEALFIPAYNFLYNLFGIGVHNDLMSYTSGNRVQFGEYMYSNVNTFLGTVYLSLNKSILFSLIFIYLFYVLLNILIVYLSKLGPYGKSAVSLIMALVFIGWFEYYFWHSFLYYIIIYSVITGIIRKYGFNFYYNRRA